MEKGYHCNKFNQAISEHYTVRSPFNMKAYPEEASPCGSCGGGEKRSSYGYIVR